MQFVLQMIWTMSPIRAQAKWAHRLGPWWPRHLAFVVNLADRALLITVMLTMAWNTPRLDRGLWRTTFPRVLYIVSMLALQLVLVYVLPITQKRAAERSATALPTQLYTSPVSFGGQPSQFLGVSNAVAPGPAPAARGRSTAGSLRERESVAEHAHASEPKAMIAPHRNSNAP